MKPIAVLGSGLAGYTLVRELRKLDRDVEITLVSRDSADFYSKPMLSNALTLTDESTLPADLVLSAVGLRPRIELARNAGLAVNRGIVVDTQLRSSDASIYALGDCAEIEGRVQLYVLPIMHAARTLARVLTGEDAHVEFPAMPVVVKTPTHPVAVLPIARDAIGSWRVLANGQGIKLGFFDAQNKLRGFALTGEYAAERNVRAKQLAETGA